MDEGEGCILAPMRRWSLGEGAEGVSWARYFLLGGAVDGAENRFWAPAKDRRVRMRWANAMGGLAWREKGVLRKLYYEAWAHGCAHSQHGGAL